VAISRDIFSIRKAVVDLPSLDFDPIGQNWEDSNNENRIPWRLDARPPGPVRNGFKRLQFVPPPVPPRTRHYVRGAAPTRGGRGVACGACRRGTPPARAVARMAAAAQRGDPWAGGGRWRVLQARGWCAAVPLQRTRAPAARRGGGVPNSMGIKGGACQLWRKTAATFGGTRGGNRGLQL